MLRCTAVAWLLIAMRVTAIHANSTPQLAVVATAEAEVRSGPSLKYYATDRLINGTEVEIYKQSPGGWCAIRPPAGSFSYIQVDAVEPTELPDVFTCNKAGMKTRVGSKLTQRFNVQYVALHPGERLQVLGAPVRLGSAQREWYPIAPPSGEFRYMRLQDLRVVERSPANERLAESHVDDATPLPDAVEPAPFPLSAEESALPLADAAPAPPATEAITANTELATTRIPPGPRGQMTTMPIPAPPAHSVATAPVRAAQRTTDGSVQLAGHATNATPPVSNAAIQPEKPQADSAWTVIPTGAAADPSWELAELELQLSQQVTREIDQWQLATIATRTRELAGQLSDSQLRRDAQRLWQRTQEFANIQRRHRLLLNQQSEEGIALVSAVTSVPSSRIATAAFVDEAPITPLGRPALRGANRQRGPVSHDPRAVARFASQRNRSASTMSPYAGRGWLVPVITARTDLPRYALTDAQGRVTSFVAAVPGLNLHRYQKHEVGVVGRTQPASARQAAYLVAERIVVLDR